MVLIWCLVVIMATCVSSIEDPNCRRQPITPFILDVCTRQDEGKTLNCSQNFWDIYHRPLPKYNYEDAEIIYLQNACVDTIRPNAFQDIRHLRHLDASHNLIRNLDYQLFNSTTALLLLDLSYNSLVTLDYRTFLTLNNLSYLDLSNNLLEKLDYRVFRETIRLSFLDISYNNLEHFDHRLLKSTSELTSLNISNNNITSIDYRTFYLTKKLTHLSTKSNILQMLDHRTFTATTNLSILDLSFNFLEILDHRLFNSLRNLVYLNLANNNLYPLLESSLFMSQQNLETLLLGYNSITTIDVNVLKPLEHIQELDLAGNKFVCNCGLYLTMLWCSERALETNATCSHPIEVRGLSWDNMNHSETCHENVSGHSVVIIAGGSAVCFVLCVVVISFTIFFCRQKVKRKAVQSSQCGLENFIYDDVAEPNDYENVGKVNVSNYHLDVVTNAKTTELDQYDYIHYCKTSK